MVSDRYKWLNQGVLIDQISNPHRHVFRVDLRVNDVGEAISARQEILGCFDAVFDCPGNRIDQNNLLGSKFLDFLKTAKNFEAKKLSSQVGMCTVQESNDVYFLLASGIDVVDDANDSRRGGANYDKLLNHARPTILPAREDCTRSTPENHSAHAGRTRRLVVPGCRSPAISD